MRLLVRILVVAMSLAFSARAFAGDPVPLPCQPDKCPPIDPCKMDPNKCKDKGGPL